MRSTQQTYTPRRMLLTSSTTAGLFGLFIAYAMFMRPLMSALPLEPGIVPTPNPSGPRKDLGQHADMARKHLSELPWTAEAEFQMGIRNNNGVVYFQRLDRGDKNRKVKFSPFAMVWYQKGRNSNETPLTVYSDSALVEFERPFDETDRRPVRVIGGTLEGAVRITGPDNLTLVGRNFHFSESSMNIWCDKTVVFTFQKHTGSARGMQIELIPDEAARKDHGFSAAGVRKMTLLQDVEMNLVTEPDNTKTRKPGEQVDEPLHTQVRCAGSFSYMLETNVATFEEDVNIQASRASKPKEIDEMLCDLLTLVFSRKADAETGKKPKDKPPEKQPQVAANKSQEPQFAGLSGDLGFQRMSADGKQVTLRSIANKMTATMTRMQYDAETRVAVLTDPRNVHVLQENSEIQSPTIELVHNEKREITDVSCFGPGWLKGSDPEKKENSLTARWQKSLRKFHDPQSGLDVIHLEQGAAVSQPGEQVEMSAESIRLWVDPMRGMSKPRTEKGSPSDRLNGVNPRYMLAENNVQLFGRKMHGTTKRLEAYFEEEPAGTNKPQKKKSAARQTVVDSAAGKQDDTKHSNGVAQAAGSSENPKSPAKAEEEDTGGPMELGADIIRIRVVRAPDVQMARVAEVVAEGNIDIRQFQELDKPPVQTTGHTVRLINKGPTEQTMYILGEPAHVRSTQMHLEGNRIDVDRAKNTAMVKGPGLLEVPVEQDLEGRALEQPQRLSIWWKERMVFDGRKTEFEGNVVTQLESSDVRCAKMVATMTKPFSFTDRNTRSDEKPEIEKVEFQGKVNFKNERYEGNILTQVQRGDVAQLLLNRQSGETTATGPGEINSWQRGHGRRAGMFPQAVVKANSASNSSKSEWEFSRTEFAGNMHGNTNQRTMTFNDRVEIVYSPVDRPEQKVDPDSGLPEGGGWLRSQALTITQRKDPKFKEGYIELLADGNAELAGRDYHGRADRVTYDESTGLFKLSGRGNNKATISQQPREGAETKSYEAQSISFTPSRNEIYVDRSTGGGGSF